MGKVLSTSDPMLSEGLAENTLYTSDEKPSGGPTMDPHRNNKAAHTEQSRDGKTHQIMATTPPTGSDSSIRWINFTKAAASPPFIPGLLNSELPW